MASDILSYVDKITMQWRDVDAEMRSYHIHDKLLR